MKLFKVDYTQAYRQYEDFSIEIEVEDDELELDGSVSTETIQDKIDNLDDIWDYHINSRSDDLLDDSIDAIIELANPLQEQIDRLESQLLHPKRMHEQYLLQTVDIQNKIFDLKEKLEKMNKMEENN